MKRVRPERGIRYVAVAGNMGSGKSSLVDWLQKQFDLVPFFEPQDENPYLADFYADMKRWAFSSQLYFLVTRFRIHLELEGQTRAVVQDRTIYEDAEVFARNLHEEGLIDDRDWQVYQTLYRALEAQLKPPDLMIYLRCPMRVLRRRIASRGRAYEARVPTAYLKRLDGLYERWFERYDRSPTLVLETGTSDYVEDLFGRRDLLETIRSRLAR